MDAVNDGRQTQQVDGGAHGEEMCAGSAVGDDLVLYLKDWHFQRLRRDAAAAAAEEVPFFFGDDWLNWW